MKNDTAEELGRIYNSVTTAVNAQESIGRPIESHGMDLFNHLVVELFDPRTRLEWEGSICDFTDPPSHETLMNFITKRVLTLNAAKPKQTSKTSGDQPRSAKSHFIKHGNEWPQCPQCKSKHTLMQCSDFKAKSPAERKSIVENGKLCFNCLGNHPIAKCQSLKRCITCKAQHHSLLHDAYAPAKAVEASALSATRDGDDSKATLLATARIRIADRFEEQHAVRALIDQGSEVSIVSEALAQRLRLPRASSTICITGIGGIRSGSTRGKVTLDITSCATRANLKVVAFILPRLSLYHGAAAKTGRAETHRGTPVG